MVQALDSKNICLRKQSIVDIFQIKMEVKR